MKYQDIQISDVSLQSQFATLWANGNYQDALDLLQNSGQLDTKAFLAEIMLKIGASLSAIEGYYYSDFEAALQLDLNEFNEAISEFRNKGDWNSTTAYKVGNVVIYNNEAYICIESNTNQLPTIATYWVLLGLVGETGVFGIDVNLKYQWRSTAQYVTNDVVVYGDTIWAALQNNSGQIPAQESEYWGVFLDFPKIKLMVSNPPPQNPYNGLIWVRVLLPYTWAYVNSLGYTFQDINNLNQNWKWINEGGW